mgnify:FL=1
MKKKIGSKVHTQSLEEDAVAEAVENEEQLEIDFDKSAAIELISYAKEEVFPVCLNDYYKALGYTELKSSVRLLKSSGFIEGDEFCVERDTEAKSKLGRPIKLYFLTIDCFKHLGMLAQTDKGKAIRSYFIAAEKELRRKEKSEQKQKGEIFYLPENDQSDAAMLVRLTHQSYLTKVALREQQEKLEALEGEVEEVNSELERYRDGHGHYFSCAGWCNMHDYRKADVQWLSKKGREAAKLCKTEGIEPVKTHDPRFGKVGTYPISVLTKMDWPFDIQQHYKDVVNSEER